MESQPSSYRREFFKSPHHVWLGLLTLGAGFISAHLLGLLAGGAAYALGWIYLPDMGFFRRWVDGRRETAKQAAVAAEVAEFVKKRDETLTSLSRARRGRYSFLADICRDIERATADSSGAASNLTLDARLRKLDELMWTYLRLLRIEESLEVFLETERREELPRVVEEAEDEVGALSKEIDTLKSRGEGLTADSKQKLLGSRLERLDVLRKRMTRCEEAQANLDLVRSEQDRLVEQIKLIRADAVASKNAAALSARIDASVQQLDETNKWISQLDQFRDLVGDMPPAEGRVGFSPSQLAPPVIQEMETAAKTKKKGQRDSAS